MEEHSGAHVLKIAGACVTRVKCKVENDFFNRGWYRGIRISRPGDMSKSLHVSGTFFMKEDRALERADDAF